MATGSNLENLVAEGRLVAVELRLGRGEMPNRRIYATIDFVAWVGSELRKMESRVGSEASPYHQVEARFHGFIIGRPLHYSGEIRDLNPYDHAVWELKTADVRIFGWFAAKDRFVAAFGDDASKIKDSRLYRGYVEACVRVREELGLDALTGGLSLVVSV